MSPVNGMVRADFHVHTSFSSDSDSGAAEMLEAEAEAGMRTVCITDHMDLDYPPDAELGEKPFLFDPVEYFRVLERYREEYRNRLDVRIGIEIGLQKHLALQYREMIRSYPFDFVIGSLHLVRGQDPYYGTVFEGCEDGDVYREALCETLANVEKIRDFDVLGHLDYVVRYGRHQARDYSYQKFSGEIDAILKKLISLGKGLEINMAGVRYGLGFCNPHPDVLKRYRELGGEIITVGSDAHRPEQTAYRFDLAAEILKTCGFRYYTEFQERRPVFLPLDG